jgi:hypothetical protein
MDPTATGHSWQTRAVRTYASTAPVVTTDLVTLNRLFAGRIALSAALRSGAIALDGSAGAVRGFGRWFGETPFAEATRPMVAKSA